MKSTIALLALSFPGFSGAANILSPADPIVAVDADLTTPASSFGGGGTEDAAKVLDANSGTKYLNGGGSGSGFIVTPAGGASTIQSFRLTSANDAGQRDPRYYQLFGTNDPITSANHSTGAAENWTLIASGDAGLAGNIARLTPGAVVNFTNTTSYASYKMVYTSVWGTTLMQVADVAFFTGSGGTGSNVLSVGSSILGIDTAVSESNTLFVEPVQDAINGNSWDTSGRKYLNFGKEKSGFIVDPASGSSIVTSMEIWTANDADARDPASYEIYGSTGGILSADNSTGQAESWSLIASGALNLPLDRNNDSLDNFSQVVNFSNSSAYDLYKVVFPTLRNSAGANSMQIGELQLYGTLVPEPSAALLSLVTAGFMLGRRRRSA